ncbi:hypothetical protein JHK82_012332 [Glycine max]|nr:hypothetical protein JHK87_012246 [Glycine soja]KAG5040214.1 hypothetical protein JHK85_012690 [Glycine max]KAG5057353.1 hypothetical protein JHK86_012349 [Glycine max]KAG5154363.1 hypothetical protein JHK82_012332 [Glycine max]
MTTPPPSPTQAEIPSDGTSRKTRQATRLRRLTARTLDQPRAIVSVNPATGRGSGPHKDKFHSYLGVVARDKIPIVHSTWNDVPETLKNMIWDGIFVNKDVSSPLKTVEEEKAAVVVDPLGELVKNLFEIYQRPVGVSWDGAKFGINNVKDGFFITHADVSEIILGDKCLNISILQLWLMFIHDWSASIGYGALYGFLELQCIHNANTRRQECENYIGRWLKGARKQIYIAPYLNQAHLQLLVLCPGDNLVVWFCSLLKKPDASIKGVVNSAMKSVSKTAEGKPPQHGPQWIEAKSHVQTGNYECGYYVMHWIWCIVSAGLKDEWIHVYFLLFILLLL